MAAGSHHYGRGLRNRKRLGSEELGSRPVLREGQALRGNDGEAEGREPEFGSGLFALGSGLDREAASDVEDLLEDSYVEEVDRALEELGASTLLGKPAVAPFGEMVARRGVKGMRN